MFERGDLRLQRDREFDQLLHAAIDSYAEPDAELARRILARVAAEPRRESRSRWLPWAIAVPVAAGLLILILFFGSHPLQRPVDRTNSAQILQPPSASKSGSERPSISNSAPGQRVQVSQVKAHRRSAQTPAKVAPLPKLQVFPTPQPLTPAERALADYVAHAPQADRQVLIETQKRMEEPLSIAAIEIQPLEPPNKGGN